MSDPPDQRVAGIGIDVEPAHADELPTDGRAEQRLAGSVEPVGAIGPVVDEAADDARAGRFAVREQVTHAVERQISKRLDGGGTRRRPAARRPVNAAAEPRYHP